MAISKRVHFFCLLTVLLVAGNFSVAFCNNFRTISGDISAYTFDTAQKIYRAVEDIEVPPGKEVQLPGGIILLFDKGTSFYIRGNCTVSGTEKYPVIFSSVRDPVFNSESPLAAPYDWKGVSISESAENVVLQNVQIKYATVPLVSRASDLRLNCILRSNTGISKFIINGDTLPVPQDKCYDFPPVVPPKNVEALTMQPSGVEPVPQPVPVIVDAVKPEVSWWKRPQFRWTIGGIGAAALLTSGGCVIGYFVKQADSTTSWNEYVNTENRDFEYRNTQKKEAVESGKTSQNFKQAGIISGVFSVLFLAGFGLTFYF